MDSFLAVLTNQVEHDQADLAATFCERVSAHERQLIEEWNATDKAWPDDPCLHELFEAQVERTPDAPAVICGGVSLSYRELNERAHRVAARLLAEGITSEEPVGLVANSTADSIVGVLGILKAGGAYLPLDTALPEDRVRYFLEDAAVRLVVGNGDHQAWLAEARINLINMGELPAADDVRLPKVSPESLAYVLYTSGSTGKAKGVMLNHRGPVNTIRDINARYDVQSRDRVLALSSLGFDLSVYDLFGMLSAGGAIVQPTAAQSRDPEQWCQLIQQHAVSIWNTVPALMDMLVTYADASATYPGLRLVMLSGDWIPVSLPERIRTAAPRAQIISLGGSTEASIWSVIFPIERVDPEWRSIPYGSAMLNQRLYVVDSDLRLCPVGEVGELCLAGVGVAVGYLNRTELTAERFVADPWQPGSVMYRTGDLCRYYPDGNLEFLGRRDHQVKIRGYRIGLGEIESEIARLPSVKEAAVVASDEGAGARLIAYVVLDAEATLDLEQLNAQLCQVLPEYMLPSALVKLAKLPLSANGKVDRRQLPRPELERLPDEIRLPTTPTESLVSEVLCKLLKLPQIDVRDDFYALGGHSLLAVALVCELRNACGVQLSVPDVLCKSFNTIKLASLIDASHRDTATVETLPALTTDGPRWTRAPLSYAQQQLWVVNFLEHKRQRYNVPLIYDIEVPAETDNHCQPAELHAQAIQFALQQLLKRHDILRTVYVAQKSRLEQIVQDDATLDLRRVDLRNLPRKERAAALDQLVLELVTQPFDLHVDVPLRAGLYQIDDRQWRLALSIHHIAIDGLSVNLIQREIAQHYQACMSGQAQETPAPALQYASYAKWQHEHMPPSIFDSERAYWREQLSGPLPVLDLPQDKDASATTEGETIYLNLDRSLFESFTQFARDRQVTPFIALLAAIKALFYRYTGQDDQLIGTPISTRSDQATQDLIGYFINVLPLRTRFDGKQGFDELLSRVRETVLGALTHRNYPLELLKKEVLSSEVAGQDPFRVMFVLEDEPEPLELPGLSCKTRLIDTQTAKFDLLIAAFVSTDGIRLELQYRRTKFRRERIEALARHLQLVLATAIQHPQQALDQLEWLPQHERAQSHGGSASTAISFLQAFAEQVAHSPDQTALTWKTERISYVDLDARSTALAGLIQKMDVQPGARVGIYMPRSPEMIIAVLAVLKSGAAYVPIDPTWPAKRRDQVLSDCQPSLLLTHSQMQPVPAELESAPVSLNVDTLVAAADCGDSYQPSAIDPASVAYILYTSGSTGRPKGVAMRHAALDNLIAWQRRTSVAGIGTKTLQFASLGFDVSFQEIFATLTTGGQLSLVDEESQQDLNKLWKFIESERIQRLFLPYVALRGLCEIAGERARDSALQEIITAGEQLQVTPVLRKFFEQLPACRLWNQYGPTETHVVTACHVDGAVSSWPARPAIGLPIDNCDVIVLDRFQRPVPKGIEGELYLGGTCLAEGYFGNPQLTSERFIDCSIPGLESKRLYRTGDLGYVDWEDEIQFVGRNDHQIKVRGHRVELSEIELALAETPGIQQAVVTVHSCGAGTQLRAHLLGARADLDITAVKDHLTTLLPAYMIPQQFTVVDHFPTTPTGKVDRLRLATQHAEQSKPTSLHRCDVLDDPVVARLKPIWQSVLQQDDLGIDADFFECGGDSLAAAILFSLLEGEFGRAISIDTLVKCPTMRKLADVVRDTQERPRDGWNKLVPLQPLGTRTPVICLPGIDGHFLNFRHMAGLLGEDRPMFGLQPVGLNGIDAPLPEIEAIAADHVRTLQAAQGQGPTTS